MAHPLLAVDWFGCSCASRTVSAAYAVCVHNDLFSIVVRCNVCTKYCGVISSQLMFRDCSV